MARPMHLRIHAAPSSDAFGLSNLFGGPRQPVMPIGDVGKVLREAAALRAASVPTTAEICDEPTRHPDFVQVQERLIGAGLIPPDMPYVLESNGEGLATCPQGHLERLRGAGLGGVRMRWFGQEATHDAFVGRPGAFAAQMAVARRLMENDLQLGAQLLLWRDSAPQLPRLRDRFLGLGPKPPVLEIAVPDSAGRAADPGLRARAEHLAGWTEGMRRALSAQTEREWAEHVRQAPELAQARLLEPTGPVYLDVYGDLSVYANLRQPLPYTFLPHLRVGKLGRESLPAVIEAADQLPLPRRLADIPLGELTDHADPDNEALYTLADVLANVWGLRAAQAALNDQ